MTVWILLILHLILCLILYVLIRIGLLKCGVWAVPFAVMVPVWGIGCLIVMEFTARGSGKAREEVGLEKLKINDEIYRSILMEEDPVEDMIVPLEEALLVNDASTRRQLLMEVMYSNPDDYVEQLMEARSNNDTEVVHYSVTALVELQKSYELRFQELYHRMEKDPKDGGALEECIELTEQYLRSGLLEDAARRVQLRNYSALLERRMEQVEADLPLWCKKIEADLMMGEYDAAYLGIGEVLEKWPKSEKGYLYLLRYYSLVKDRRGVDRVLELIGRREIYLSPEGRSELKFWQE